MKHLKEYKLQMLLGVIVLAGFIFRIINAFTRPLFGDPPHFCLQAVNFLHSGLLVTWDQSTYLWYAVTNIFYNILGITQFASRFSSVLFGTLTIILIYLFAYKFSGKKRIALISAAIYAFAPAFILNAADEHDISVLFFIILSFYCLICGLKDNSKKYLLLSGVFFGVACMWKAYVPILIIPYLGFAIYYHYTKRFNIRKNLKTFILIFIIIFALVSPTLVYNYLNYKHNGVPTFFFVKFFMGLNNNKINSLYGWVSGGELYQNGSLFTRVFINSAPDSPNGAPPFIYTGITYSLYANGHILSFMALFSILFLFIKRKNQFAKDYLVFFLLYFIIPFIFLINSNFLHKHYVQFFAFAIPMIAFTINELYDYAREKIKILKKLEEMPFLTVIIVILFVFFIILPLTSQNMLFFSKNPDGKFISYKRANIPEDSLIVYDDRIYNSLAGWLLNDRYYIPVSSLSQFMSYNEKSPSKQAVPVYFIECAIDDCGWGTIASNQPLNKSMENFFLSLQNQSIQLVEAITRAKEKTTSYYNPLLSQKLPQEDYFKIYRAQMSIDLSIAKQIKPQFEYFLYPTGYLNKESQTFKNFIYQPEGLFEDSINKFAWLVFYLNILISFFAILFVLYEVYLHL